MMPVLRTLRRRWRRVALVAAVLNAVACGLYVRSLAALSGALSVISAEMQIAGILLVVLDARDRLRALRAHRDRHRHERRPPSLSTTEPFHPMDTRRAMFSRSEEERRFETLEARIHRVELEIRQRLSPKVNQAMEFVVDEARRNDEEVEQLVVELAGPDTRQTAVAVATLLGGVVVGLAAALLSLV